MRFLITAGGTREPIDAVRVVANRSTGRLGARIAERAAARGHHVVLLHAEGSVRPEVAHGAINEQVFETSADLGELLATHAPRADVVVHAAAVSDYIPEMASGKLSSQAPELVLVLKRAPKLIDALRGQCPRGVLVGFKLTSGQAAAEQLDVARALLGRARLDLVVANDSGALGTDDHRAVLVPAQGAPRSCQGKQGIAAELVAEVERLAGQRQAGHVVQAPDDAMEAKDASGVGS